MAQAMGVGIKFRRAEPSSGACCVVGAAVAGTTGVVLTRYPTGAPSKYLGEISDGSREKYGVTAVVIH